MRLGTLSQGTGPYGATPSAAEMAAQQGFIENTGGAPLQVSAPYQYDPMWGYQTPAVYWDSYSQQWVQIGQPETTAAGMAMMNQGWPVSVSGLGMFTPQRKTRVPRYFGGMGDIVSLGDTAQCPSLEQLQGIVDINDPCQAATLPLTTVPTMAGSVPPSPPSSMSGFTIGGITISPWMVLAAVVVGVMVIGGTGGRR